MGAWFAVSGLLGAVYLVSVWRIGVLVVFCFCTIMISLVCVH